MSNPAKNLYEFGDFRIDARRRLLLRRGEVLPLTPKAFDTLLVLVENRARVIEKDELMEAVWGETIVEESGLARNISVLRKALGESKDEHQYIVTVPGRGYRFVADVQEVTSETAARETTNATELVIQESKVRVVLEEEEDGEMVRPGDSGTQVRPLPRPSRLRLSAAVVAAFAILVILVVGLADRWREKTKPPEQRAAAPTIRSLAVLPFKTLNPQPGSQRGDEYLGLGMADVMITRLSNLSELVVRPTSSVLPFGAQDPLQAGQALKVDSVLDGSIQQIGDRVRVTVRLVRTSDGQSLWAYQCDEKCTDIFALQDIVSARVVDALALELTSDERQRLNRRYTQSAEAHREYLKGRFFTLQYSEEGFRKAVTHFTQALALDPGYALAWAGLADAYTTASEEILSPREALSKAGAAAEKALALDDTVAEAHSALGHVQLHLLKRDAERELRRALELNPNSINALLWFGEYWMIFDPHETLPIMKRVEQLDPLSPLPFIFSGYVWGELRRHDQAIESLRKALELSPNYSMARGLLGVMLFENGKTAEAEAELVKAIQLDGAPLQRAALAYIYARAGRRREAEQILLELKRLSGERYVSPFHFAVIYAGLNDTEQAFAWLEKAREDQSEYLGFIKWDVHMDGIRNDPRFAALERRVGLTTEKTD